MGKVVQLRARHRATSRMLKTAGSATILFFFNAAEIAVAYRGGIESRAAQLLTAGEPTPKRSATAAVPPKASMMSRGVRSIPQDRSRNVIMSSGHVRALDFTWGDCSYVRVAQTQKTIAKRLVDTREALGLNAADLCRIINCAPNRWSQYETGARKITWPIANALCDQFGVTLDWIYRGNPSGLPYALRMKIADASAA